ncbi:3093_t:CDS:10 [Funneliformis mosseae]|uniref:3093_t:CDS:1 n=1 Tax=Funneliformis mosseae TaxID=27381 RepID=A0A9N9BCE5_FUNMO|nr:3093_t:CDS:10 [Funneliformis mosseae]
MTMANWEVFKSLEELQEFLNSNNYEILYQGINRFRQHFIYPKDKNIKEIDSINDKNVSIAYEYLQTSPECKELFIIWDTQLHDNLTRLELSIPDLFSKIIKFTTITPSLKSTGTIVIRNVIRNYMRVIRNNLSSEKLPLCQNTLKLLIIMNSHDPSISKELLESFTYNLNLKELGRLLNIRRNTSKDNSKNNHSQNDIRTLYVRFILSFFVHGNAKIKSNVLEIKDFASLIFKGLLHDSYEFVDEVLRKVYDHIILDNDINRKTILSFFNNTWLLNQLLHLYNRRESEQHEPDKIVANIVHRFLLSICCTPGVGICFRDAGWYPFNYMNISLSDTDQHENEKQTKVHNIILLQFIKSLKPTQDLRQQELLLKILESCPELVKPYWKTSKISFEPKLSYKWLANVTLLHKIIALPVPSFYIPGTQIYPENPPELNVILDNILPRIFDQDTLIKCLDYSSSLIRYKTMIVLCLAFQKLNTVVHSVKKAISYLDNLVSEAQIIQRGLSKKEATSSIWSQTIDSLYEEMKHRIPDIQILLNFYYEILEKEKGFSSNMMSNEDNDEFIRNNLMHEGILKSIKFYYLFYPEMMMEIKLDVDNLIPMDFQESQVGLQLNMMELLLLIAESNWSINSEFNHLQKLLKLFLTTPYLQIRSITQRVLERLLSNSITFQHDPDEVSIWLDSLPRIFPENANFDKFNGQATVLKFFDNCFVSFLKNPRPYIDDLSQVINVINERMEDFEDIRITKENAFVQQFLISRDGPKYSNASYPFSPLLVTLVKSYESVTENKVAITSFLHILFKKLYTKQLFTYYLDEYVERLERNLRFKNNRFLEYIGNWGVNEFFSSLERISSLYKYPSESSLSVDTMIDIPVIINGVVQEDLNQNLMKAEKVCLENLKDKNPDRYKARSEFLDMLYVLPVPILERNLPEILCYIKNVLGWAKFEPILEYIYERYPSSGSLFNVRVIKEAVNAYLLPFFGKKDSALTHNAVEESEISLLIEFLDLTPFSIFFDNSFPSHLMDKNIGFLLNKSLRSIPLQNILHTTRQILFATKTFLSVPCYNLIQGLQTCFNLLKIIIEKVTEETEDDDGTSKIFDDIINLILGLEDLSTLFLISVLEGQNFDSDFIKYYSVLDEFIAELVIYFTNNDNENIIWKTRRVDALRRLLPFKSKLFNRLLCMTNSENLHRDGNMLLYNKMCILCYKFDNFWNEAEIFQLFSSLLESKFYNPLLHDYVNLISHYKKLLSYLINKLSRALLITKTSEEILMEFFSCHEIEMDSIILQIIEKYLPPGITKENNSLLYFSERQNFHPLPNKCVEVARYFLDNLNNNRAKIIGYFMLCNSEVRKLFVNWILNHQNLSERIAIPDMIILVNSLLEIISTIHMDFKYSRVTWTKFARESDKKSIKKISDLFALKFFHSISKSMAQEKPSVYALVTCALLNLSPSQQVLDTLDNDIKNNSPSDSFNLDFLYIIECYLLDNFNYYNDEIKKFISNFLHYATLFIEKDEYKKYSIKVIQNVFSKVDVLIKLVVPRCSNLDANIIGEFIFVLMEKKFEDPIILNCIITLITYAYDKKEVFGPSLDRVIEAIINNSQFKILANPSELSYKSIDSSTFIRRLTICHLLNTLYRMNSKECCKSSYLSSLLSIYNATTSISDQLLLDIFILYEKTTKSSIVSSAMKWGTSSSSYKQQVDKRGLIMGQRILVETLELIDPMIMMRSFTRFPIDKELEINYNNFKEFLLFDKNNDIIFEREAPVYDPSYFLPLFANLLSYGNLLDCRKFIEINALGYIVVATSSLIANVRKAAYYLLDEFYVLLENFQKERVWILRLLSAGLKTHDDYKIFKRRYVWDIISCYYNSPLADNITRKLVIEILFQAASIPKVITDMIKNRGLLTWLHHLCISQQIPFSSASRSLFEQSLFGPRILLRVLQGCKNSTLQWSNEDINLVKKETLPWALNYLNSILRVFHYLTLISFASKNVLLPYHASIIIPFLEKCEIQLKTLAVMNNNISHPIEIQYNYHPSLTDNLDVLYTMNYNVTEIYQEIIRMLFEMIICCDDEFDDNLMEKIIGRALCCNVTIEAKKWVIECLVNEKDEERIDYMEIDK